MKKLVFLAVFVLVLVVAANAPAALVGEWTFENGTTDTAGGAQAGTLMNGAAIIDDPTSVRGGKVLALYGSPGGIDDYMNVGGGRASEKAPPTWADSEDFKLEMWAKLNVDADSGWWGMAGKMTNIAYPGNANTFYIEYNPGNWMEFKTYGNGPQPNGTFCDVTNWPNDQQWHKYEFVYNAAVTAVYIDGALALSLANDYTNGPRTYGPGDIWIGALSRWSGEAFNGYIDDVRWYDTPEPATMALLGLGGLALLRRKVRN
jgi:hypothetical protein